METKTKAKTKYFRRDVLAGVLAEIHRRGLSTKSFEIHDNWQPHFGQQKILFNSTRFKVVICGRRFGKTELAVNICFDKIMSGQRVAYFAPTNLHLRIFWTAIKEKFAALEPKINNVRHNIETNGGVLHCWSLEATEPALGEKYNLVILDEAAVIKNLETLWMRNIMPTLTDYSGDAIFFSTPRGMNYLYQLWCRGNDPLEQDWQSWQMPTSENPHIDSEEIELMRSQLPEMIFQQEFLAQFITDGNGVFRNVQELNCLEREEPREDTKYSIGVDWGRMNDFTVISVWDIKNNREVYLDRFNKIDYEFQIQRLKAVCDVYKPIHVMAEWNSIGDPVISQARKLGINIEGFVTTNISKKEIVENLSVAMERRTVQMQKSPEAVSEMLSFGIHMSPNGKTIYEAENGAHDDIVMARCIGYHSTQKPTSMPAKRPTTVPSISRRM